MTRIVPVTVLCLLLAACGSRINQDNYNRVEPGMSEAEVVAILGKADAADSYGVGSIQGTKASWRTNDAEIVVMFLNGKVKTKRYSAPPDADAATQ